MHAKALLAPEDQAHAGPGIAEPRDEAAVLHGVGPRTIAPPFITSRMVRTACDVAGRIAVDRDEVGEQARRGPRRPGRRCGRCGHCPRWRRSARRPARMPRRAISSISRAFSPCGKTPTSPPMQIGTPASSAAREAGALVLIDCGLGRGAVPAGITRDGVGWRRASGNSRCRARASAGRSPPCRHCHARSCRRRRGWRGACLRRRGMDRDDAAGGMRGRDAGVNLVDGEGRPARLAWAPAIIGVEFDDVGAGRRSGARTRGHQVRRRPLPRRRAWRRRLGALGAVGAGRDERAGRDEQARPRHDALRRSRRLRPTSA